MIGVECLEPAVLDLCGSGPPGLCVTPVASLGVPIQVHTETSEGIRPHQPETPITEMEDIRSSDQTSLWKALNQIQDSFSIPIRQASGLDLTNQDPKLRIGIEILIHSTLNFNYTKLEALPATT